MCSRHSELRGGNNCGAEEVSCGKMPWLPCITRASLPFSDRSAQIKSDILFLSNPYFADRCMDWLSLNMATDALIFASAALWIDLPDIQKRRGGDLWLKLITVNTRRPIGYDDMRFSSGAIDFDWSIDQGGGSRRIDHSPDGSWQENKIKDCFLIFVLKWRRDVSSQFWHS